MSSSWAIGADHGRNQTNAQQTTRTVSKSLHTVLSHFHDGRDGCGLRNRVTILAHTAEVYLNGRSDAFPDIGFGLPGRTASGEVGNRCPVPRLGALNYDGAF